MSDAIPPRFRPSARGQRPATSDAQEVRGSGRPSERQAGEVPPTIPPKAPASRPPHTPQIAQQPDGTRLPPQYAPQPRAVQPHPPQQQVYGQPAPQPVRPAAPPPSSKPRARRRRRSRAPRIIATLLVLLLAWPIGLLIWANSRIQHVEALSGATGTPGTTYLLVGSDSRADGQVQDGAEGQRADTIILLHSPRSGSASMISLPRDTYVEIPGYGANKLNAAFAFGGPELLVQTVEGTTGISVDHYVEIGMGGVVNVVDAVGGVELCLDYDVNDELSALTWTAGCHHSDGETALAFARMRYSDPLGDFGRQQRQRQVISAVTRAAATPATVINPARHVSLIDAGVGALATDTDSGIIDLARLALAFRAATGEAGVSGAPPIADTNYQPGGVGSTVLLSESAGDFFGKVLDGTVTQADVHQFN